MSGRKNTLRYQTITNGNMASATITSSVSNITRLDNIGIQFNWAGAPVGTFAIQVSADYAQDTSGNVTNAGHWTPLNLTISTSGGSPVYVDLNQLSAPWLRTVYTKASGTGTLQAWLSAKMI